MVLCRAYSATPFLKFSLRKNENLLISMTKSRKRKSSAGAVSADLSHSTAHATSAAAAEEEDLPEYKTPPMKPPAQSSRLRPSSLPNSATTTPILPPGPQDIGISELLLGAARTPPPRPSFARGFTLETLTTAAAHLRTVDPILAPLIDQHGIPDRLLAKGPGSFSSLAKSIVFQQLATRAAAVIYARVLTVCGPECVASGFLAPGSVLAAPEEALRGAGLSQRKVSYLKDLSTHFNDDRLSDDRIDVMTAEELHKALTAVKGLGPWSVDMFCLFHLGLHDVLPVGDLGVRKGMQELYALKELPGPGEMEQVAEKWKPYRSLGSFYMWRVETVRGSGAASKKKGKKN